MSTTNQESYIPEDINCPVCLEIPTNRIYQCSNGHIICEDCVTSIVLCPQCRALLRANGQPLIRNRAAEHLLLSFTLECSYKEEGCSKRISKNQLADHLQSCKFNPSNKIYICQRLGFDCDFKSNENQVADAVKHLKERHFMMEYFVRRGQTIRLQMNNLACHLEEFARIDDQNGDLSPYTFIPQIKWKPVIVRINERYLVLIAVLERLTNSLSWTCYTFTEASQNNIKVRYALTSQSFRQSKNLLWTCPTKSLFDPEWVSNSPLQVAVTEVLKEYLDNTSGALEISVQVIGNRNTRFNNMEYVPIYVDNIIPHDLNMKLDYGKVPQITGPATEDIMRCVFVTAMLSIFLTYMYMSLVGQQCVQHNMSPLCRFFCSNA